MFTFTTPGDGGLFGRGSRLNHLKDLGVCEKL